MQAMRGKFVTIPGEKGNLLTGRREGAKHVREVFDELEFRGVEIQLEMHGGRRWQLGKQCIRHSALLLSLTRNGTQCSGPRSVRTAPSRREESRSQWHKSSRPHMAEAVLLLTACEGQLRAYILHQARLRHRDAPHE